LANQLQVRTVERHALLNKVVDVLKGHPFATGGAHVEHSLHSLRVKQGVPTSPGQSSSTSELSVSLGSALIMGSLRYWSLIILIVSGWITPPFFMQFHSAMAS
jgi:hypothetical protein